MIQLFNNLKLDNRNILLVTNDMNDNVLLSARNLQYVDVMRVSDLATYNIMRAKSLVFVESSVQGLNEMFNLNEE
jgi:large subunit ribosomal protein L4